MLNYRPDIVKALKAGDESAFSEIFDKSYAPLLNLAMGMVDDHQLAEEQVQEVFVRFWELRHSFADDLKVFAYLVRSVRNKCYNVNRHKSVQLKHINYVQRQYRDEILQEGYDDDYEEKLLKVMEAVGTLPEKCREVFELSRFEGLSHKEIAERLSISTKTVENHITKAMNTLKSQLLSFAHFFVVLLGDMLN